MYRLTIFPHGEDLLDLVNDDSFAMNTGRFKKGDEFVCIVDDLAHRIRLESDALANGLDYIYDFTLLGKCGTIRGESTEMKVEFKSIKGEYFDVTYSVRGAGNIISEGLHLGRFEGYVEDKQQ